MEYKYRGWNEEEADLQIDKLYRRTDTATSASSQRNYNIYLECMGIIYNVPILEIFYFSAILYVARWI